MVLLQSVVSVGPARAQTIVNVANASWSHDGREYSGRSNPVELQVATRPPEITTYVPGIGEQYTIYRPACGTSFSTSSTSANAPTLTNVKATSVLRAGQDLIFTIALPDANSDSGAIDSLTVRINGRSGDQEQITVFETGENTGIFAGRIATRRTPPPVQPGDCVLSVVNEDIVTISALRPGEETIVLQTTVNVLADPFGVVFDSETGAPVSGAIVSLVDAITGQPAQVFAEDGVTPWPSTVISGEPVTDAAGNVVEMGAGEFWFPLTNLGTYVLRIEPPSPYSAPSQASPEEIARLTRPDGRSFVITDASYGASFVLTDPTPVQIDIPLDAPSGAIAITKEASRQIAQPGDAIFYTLTVRNTDPFRVKRDVTVVDTPSVWLRPRLDSVRIDGEEPAQGTVSIAPDGRSLQFSLGDIAGGRSSRIVYAMTVRPDAQPGYANNVAEVTDSLGRSSLTEASVRVERDVISGRMTIIGRISAGDCGVRSGRLGIPGVRVMLEDGSFAITDRDGRYHFDGVVPGTHVVQVSPMTLPEGSGFVDCNRSSRSAGSATSLFVIGQGGSLAVADFHATVPDEVLEQLRADAAESASNSLTLSDTVEGDAVPDETDWLSLGDGPDGWLAPTLDANPRAPAIRVAIRHRKEHKVRLFVDGKPVDALAFDGIRKPERGGFAVSTWRGVPLSGERTLLAAEIVTADGTIVSRHERPVFFTNLPAKVELVAEQSSLVADGRTRPVVAVRILDRNNRPLREGVSGDFTLNAPYESAEQISRQQLNQLTRQGPTSARWTVADASGIAFIELAPTMTSGALQLTFRFDDGEVSREQQLETWIAPGDIDWTVVGLAEASVGARTVADGMDRAGNFASDLGEEARVAIYAKGPVTEDLLVTFAYDSAKDRGDQRVLGTLDPQAYYTVFGDASVRQFDAASREKVYARVEGPAFNVQYGDFETDFDQTRLTNYRRVATGVSGEARLGQFGIKAFGAEAGTRFRRDEIQGQGISGPYRLGSRAIVPNTESVILEVRDRFRSELIVERRELTRFLDYDIDFLAGTISFKQPVLSRDFDLNPQFIVIEYETDQLGGGVMNAGGRIDWRNAGDTLRIGATMISDGGDELRTNIVGLDLRARLGNSTELRAEIAGSRTSGENSMAWLVEAQHQSGSLDLLAYAKSVESTYGVGQQNDAELGRRKIGADARVRVSEQVSVIASLWQDDSLTDAARRRAAQIELGYSSTNSDIRVGIAHFDDRLPDGTSNRSTVLEAGATQRMFHNKLELTAATSMPLDSTDSVDLPLRHRVGARYAITNDVRIVADYEFADGNGFESSTLRGGFELTPWIGGRVSSTLGKQDIGERGNRSFAAFGLAQTWQVNPKLSLDATFDSNWTLDGSPRVDDLVNVDQPAASGGQFGPGGALFEDFTAITLGGAWRDGAWSATARGEYRDGEYADRWGVSLGAIRQLGEGSVVGSGFSWTTAEGTNGAQTEVMDAAIALAHRPAESEIAFLGKLEFRSDSVSNAVLGEAGPAGRTALTVSGDAGAKRLIASLSTNWSPRDGDEAEELARRSEIGLFLGARYNLDSYGGFELDSVSTFAGLDARIGIADRFEIGASATVRANLGDDTVSYAVGPNVGFVPAKGVLLNVGYNVTGFRDPDFSGMRNTDEGLYASVRIKFDADSFSFLGLGRK